jgi:hypothetical protein
VGPIIPHQVHRSIMMGKGTMPLTKNYFNNNPLLSSFMAYHLCCNKNNMMLATCGAGTAYLSGAPEFTTCF